MTDLVDLVHDAIKLLSPMEVTILNESTDLVKDLGFHSLAFMELQALLEDLFSKAAPGDASLGLEAIGQRPTVQDVVTVVEESLASGIGEFPDTDARRRAFLSYMG
jgi:acyl carrier protein